MSESRSTSAPPGAAGTSQRPRGTRRGKRWRTTYVATGAALAVALSPLVGSPATGATPKATPQVEEHDEHSATKADNTSLEELSKADTRALATAKLAPQKPLNTDAVDVPKAADIDPIDQRILVIGTNGDPNPDGVNTVPTSISWDWTLSTLTNALDYLGMPYDTYKSTTKQICRNGSWKLIWTLSGTTSNCTSGSVVSWANSQDPTKDGLTTEKLRENDVHAYYSGVMLADGGLWYTNDGANFAQGLSPAEWATLWAFEAHFGIRMVSAFTSPTPDYGLTSAGSTGATTTATWTAAGKAAFPYVSDKFPISGSMIYLAKVDPAQASTTTPILTSGTNVLGVIKKYPDQGNRETLALTFNSARYLTHGLLLGYGLVNWVNKGQVLGFRKALLDPQVDDIFIESDQWRLKTGQLPTCGMSTEDPALATYRMTGADLQATVKWQNATRTQPLSSALRLSFPFNGTGSVSGYWPNDTLTAAATTNRSAFKWVNHTYTHLNMDAPTTYAQARDEIKRNNQRAVSLGLYSTLQSLLQQPSAMYSPRSMIQPDISGLTNANFLRGAYDEGVRYLISDTSRTGNPGVNGPNEGLFNKVDPRLFEVARYPVNLYYNVGTPEEWLHEDNCLYPAGAFGHVDTYQQLLDRESENLLKYLLQGDNRPLMFHQENLRAYNGTKSLLTDLIDATLVKYRGMVNVPITSPNHDQLAVLQQDRIKYNDAWKNGGLFASVEPAVGTTVAKLNLKSNKAVVAPLTGYKIKGLSACSSTVVVDCTETYAGQQISYIKLTPGQLRTFTLA